MHYSWNENTMKHVKYYSKSHLEIFFELDKEK